jgi:hypothetical protein
MEERQGKFVELKVGDGLFMTITRYRDSDKNGLEPCEVVKVGRKYVTVKNMGKWSLESQFERDTGYEKSEGYSQNRRQLVISEYQWNADRKRDAVYNDFHRKIANLYRSEVSEANIREAAKLLDIELKKQED